MSTTTNDQADETKIEPGTGHTRQTFLIGEQVYLRPIQSGDEKYAASWKQGIVRSSVSSAEKWIEEDLKDEESLHLMIVRKSDDRIVGSLVRDRWKHNIWIDGYIDPLFGDQGDLWLAEAYCMMLQWSVDEQHRLVASINRVPGNKPVILEKLEEIGARSSSIFHEAQRVGDAFIDWHIVTYLNKDWVRTLGDPYAIEKPRTGTGEPRPVIAPVDVEGDNLPLNAIRVGPRVYLRPLQKADAAKLVEWSRRETEPFWSSGRDVVAQTSAENWFERLGKTEPQTWVRFAVCLRENDEYIGSVGVDQIDYDNRCGESESEFHNVEYRSKGYGTEAKHLLFDYAFNTLGLHSLQSWVMYGNTRSAAALRKQGYKDVGIEPWLVRRDGGYECFGTYELLADEWRAMPRARVEEAGDLAG
ncbi:MAG: GNAT family N-acetyltransferase [Thermomicrobiales bacterium]|nr:GNAT family N-acetyltransferase [Thermomicrobiales bacterium]